MICTFLALNELEKLMLLYWNISHRAHLFYCKLIYAFTVVTHPAMEGVGRTC